MHTESSSKYNNICNVCMYSLCLYVRAAEKLDGIKIRDHRGHDGDDFIPESVLESDSSTGYESALNEDFAPDENDWIIFDFNGSRKVKQIRLLNCDFDHDVKDFIVYVTSDDGEGGGEMVWKEIAHITALKTGEWQEFDVDMSRALTLRGRGSCGYVKLEFVSNHGWALADWPKYMIEEVQFWGV